MLLSIIVLVCNHGVVFFPLVLIQPIIFYYVNYEILAVIILVALLQYNLYILRLLNLLYSYLTSTAPKFAILKQLGIQKKSHPHTVED